MILYSSREMDKKDEEARLQILVQVQAVVDKTTKNLDEEIKNKIFSEKPALKG